MFSAREQFYSNELAKLPSLKIVVSTSAENVTQSSPRVVNIVANYYDGDDGNSYNWSHKQNSLNYSNNNNIDR